MAQVVAPGQIEEKRLPSLCTEFQDWATLAFFLKRTKFVNYRASNSKNILFYSAILKHFLHQIHSIT